VGQALEALPLVGPTLGRCLSLALFGHTLFVYGAFALVAAVAWLLYRTRFGLRLRAAGENPAMVDAAGVSVLKLRYQALALNGVLAALAAIRLQGAQLPAALGGGAVPVQAIQALPYVLTVVLLAGFIGHAVAPRALGTPYVKERH